ncbi:hypothetical protein SAMD00019534_003100, partial [Acytostelium subglobosum LB1]|uniref:hypothetical protein n=1 Tax=Acytostelium subglobosum LB1 TaxID=1410327 RepID=UPI0006450210
YIHMENVVSKELDYTPLLVAEPEYEYTRLFPQSGTTQTTVYAGGNDTIFEIPPSKAYNLSRSFFRFIFNLPGIANKNQLMFADFCPFFRQIQVFTRGGLYLMDHTNFHLHAKMVTMRNKPLVETENTFASYTAGDDQYIIPCVSSQSPIAYRVTIPFNELYESVLSVDKDIMLNETLLVRFVWSELSNIAFAADPPGALPDPSPAIQPNPFPNPTTGPAPIPAPANFNITDMAIYLAVEKNLAIVNELQSKIQSPEGFSFMIPYCYSYQASLTGQNQSVTLRVNRQNGMTLERIYHSLFLTATAINTAIYNNNWRATNLDHYYTNLNNNRLMQYDYYLLPNDDYMALRWILKDSTILNPQISKRNWCWIEEFGDGTSNFNKDNAITGIDLNLGEQKWDFVGFLSAATNLTHQSTVVCKRKMVITPNGIVL